MAAARAVNPSNQCLKVFVQRDYSEGTLVKFQTRFPTELEDRVGNRRQLLEIEHVIFITVCYSTFILSSAVSND